MNTIITDALADFNKKLNACLDEMIADGYALDEASTSYLPFEIVKQDKQTQTFLLKARIHYKRKS